MSRIGKQPVQIPPKVKVEVKDRDVLVEGPKGKLNFQVPNRATVAVNGDKIIVSRTGDDAESKALHGLTRALTANAVQGVSTGFTRELDIVGIGYRADVKGNTVVFTLGYSHSIEFWLPPGVVCKIEKQTHLTLTGSDKQMLGQISANMRALRPPDPYKNKGVRYTGEKLKKKVGKTGAGAK